MTSKEYYVLNDIANIFKGYSTTKLNNPSKQLKENPSKEREEFETVIEEDVKVLGWKQIKEYVKTKKIDDSSNIIKMNRKYNKDINYIQKGDIVLPAIPSKDFIDIVYIDEEPPQKCIYNASVIVIRVTQADIDSMYIYMMLKEARPIQNGLLKTLSGELLPVHRKITSQLTKDILARIYIAKPNEVKRKKLLDKYLEAQKMMEDVKSTINDIQIDKEAKSSVVWFKG